MFCNFQGEANEQLAKRKAEDQLSEQLIASSKRREYVLASRALDKIENMLSGPTGPWTSQHQK